MRVSAGNPTAVRYCNTANSSMTIGTKKENMNKRIGSVQFDSEVLRKPALHIAKPLQVILKNGYLKHYQFSTMFSN